MGDIKGLKAAPMPGLARLTQADPIEKLIKPAKLELGQNKGWVMLTGAAKPAGDSFDFSATDVARNSTAFADTVHDFKKQVESMSKSYKKAGELGKPLSGDFAASAGRIAGMLKTVAGTLDDVEMAARIPEATTRLNSAWNAYQRDPSPQNATTLHECVDDWSAAIKPLVEKIPDPAVKAELVGMLDIATKVIGGFAELVSKHSKKAMDSSREDVPMDKVAQPQLPPMPDIRPDLPTPPAVKDLADYLLARTAEQWGTEPMKPSLQKDHDAMIKLAREFAAVDAKCNGWQGRVPVLKGQLADERAALKDKLYQAIQRYEEHINKYDERGSHIDLRLAKEAL